MSLSFTVDDLVVRVQREAQIATDNSKVPTATVVDIADEEIQTVLWPLLRSASEDYGVESIDLTVPYVATASDPLKLSGTIRLPPYLSSSTISGVFYIDSNSTPYELPRWDVMASQYAPTSSVTAPAAYTLRGDMLVLVPTPSQATTIRVFYEARPNHLMQIALASNVGTFSVPPGQSLDSWTPSGTVGPGVRFDIIAAQPPLGVIARYLQSTSNALPPPPYPRLYLQTDGDLAASGFGFASTTPDIITTAGSPTGYYAPSGYTCVFPLPEAWYGVAVTQIATRVLRTIGDTNEADALTASLEQRKAALLAHQGNRSRKQPRILWSPNTPLRSRAWGYRR